MAFNLSTVAVSKESYDVQLRHPATDELLFDGDKAVTITIQSKASDVYRSAQLKQQNARLKTAGIKAPITMERIIKDGTDLLIAVTVGASNLEYKGSTDIDFSVLYNDPEMYWLKDQVFASLEDTAGFLEQ